MCASSTPIVFSLYVILRFNTYMYYYV
jgi:hypothetical protein